MGDLPLILLALSVPLWAMFWVIRSQLRKIRSEARSAEARVGAVLDSASEGIVLLDSEGRVQRANAALLRMMRVSEADLVGLPVRNLFAAQAPARAGLKQVLQYARARANWLREHAPDCLRAVLDAAPLGVLEIDAGGRIRYANPAARLCLRDDGDGLKGLPVDHLLPPELRQGHSRLRTEWMRAPQEMAMAGRLLPVLCRDGSVRRMELGLTPLDGKRDGRVLAWLFDDSLLTWHELADSPFGAFFAEEVRTPKSLESDLVRFGDRFGQALRTDRKGLWTLLKPAPLALLLVDAQGQIVFANTAMERVSGYAVAQLRGRPLSVLVPSRYAGAHAGQMAQFRESNAAHRMGEGRATQLRHASGIEMPVEVALVNVDAGGDRMTLALVRSPSDLSWEVMRQLSFGSLFEDDTQGFDEGGVVRRLRVAGAPSLPVLSNLSLGGGAGEVVDGVQRIALSLTDVSALLAREQSVRDAHAFTEKLLHTLQDGLLVLDRQGVVTRANRIACEITGHPLDEVLGQSLGCLLGRMCEVEPEEDNFWHWLPGAHGWGLQQMFQESSERFWIRLWEMQKPMLVFSNDRRVAFANPAAERMLGYDAGGLLDLPVQELFDEDELEGVRRRLHLAFGLKVSADVDMEGVLLRHRSGQLLSVPTLLSPVRTPDAPLAVLCLSAQLDTGEGTPGLEIMLQRPDGSSRFVLLSGAPIYDDAGRVSGAVMTLRDLSELSTLRENERLHRQVARQERLSAVGQLAAGIAHDFNNLLGAIQGHAELVEMKSPPEAKVGRNVQAILQSVDRARALVQKLASVHKEQARSEVLGRFDLTALLAELHGLLEASLRGIALEIDRDEREGEPVPSCWLAGDAGEFQQVLVNLCVNAGHALRGRRDGRIRINLQRAPAAVTLTVEDNGCGIAADILPRIFDPFFTTREVGEGSGLGLAMVHGIVTRMGGEIDVESVPDLGTRFTLTLPLAVDG